MKVVIVIPTYNEADNVSKLLPALEQEFRSIKHDCQVLIVDGNSTDGTADVVLDYAQSRDWVNLLVETKKEGLGRAYVKGFEKAMHELNADIVMEMDGDLQHNPADIKRFIEEIEDGADYVIGSRYIEGGSIPKEWEFYRKFLSWGGNLFTRFVLWMWNITDFTTGFKATRVKGVMDQLDLTEVMSGGFAYKIDLLYKTFKLGADVREIPIEFGLRDKGISKMEQNNPADSIRVVLSIRMNENKSFIRFLIVGLIGMFVDFSLANLFKFSKMEPSYAGSMSAVVAMFTTFTLNNIWSFEDKKITEKKAIAKSFIPYVAFSVVPIAFRFWFIGFMIALIEDSWLVYNGAILFSIFLGIFWNYFTYSKFIWGSGRKKVIKENEEFTGTEVDSDEKKKETENGQKKETQLDSKDKDLELQKKIAEKMKEIKN